MACISLANWRKRVSVPPPLAQGKEIAGDMPKQFADLINAEAPCWGKVIKDAAVKLD